MLVVEPDGRRERRGQARLVCLIATPQPLVRLCAGRGQPLEEVLVVGLGAALAGGGRLGREEGKARRRGGDGGGGVAGEALRRVRELGALVVVGMGRSVQDAQAVLLVGARGRQGPGGKLVWHGAGVDGVMPWTGRKPGRLREEGTRLQRRRRGSSRGAQDRIAGPGAGAGSGVDGEVVAGRQSSSSRRGLGAVSRRRGRAGWSEADGDGRGKGGMPACLVLGAGGSGSRQAREGSLPDVAARGPTTQCRCSAWLLPIVRCADCLPGHWLPGHLP